VSLIQELIFQLPHDKDFGLVQQIHGHFYYAKLVVSSRPDNESSAEDLVLASKLTRDKLQDENTKSNLPLSQNFKANLTALTLPTRLQKEKVEVFVGDIVEIDLQNKTVKSVVPRLSMLPRPKVANIDQAFVVVAATQPEVEPEHLDRILCHAGITLPMKPIICLTKVDLIPEPPIFNIYRELGYTVISLSNKTGQGIEKLKPFLYNKAFVLAGASGAGKSSLLKALCPQFKIKVGDVSQKSERGTHTTRHSEIFEVIEESNSYLILDTPGFSRLDAHCCPTDIAQEKSFPEIGFVKEACYFPDCKHTSEKGCVVSFTESRKASYVKLISEAERWEREQLESKRVKDKKQTTKQDSGTEIPMLKVSQRSNSRKRNRQSFNLDEETQEISELEDELEQ
jgi:ribosome biogenesis GTPase